MNIKLIVKLIIQYPAIISISPHNMWIFPFKDTVSCIRRHACNGLPVLHLLFATEENGCDARVSDWNFNDTMLACPNGN